MQQQQVEPQWTVDDQADYYALTSAVARAFWELHILRPHRRDPGFYVQQSLGAFWDELVRAPASGWSDHRASARLLPRLLGVPAVLQAGIIELESGRGEMVATFAQTCLAAYFPDHYTR